MNTEAVIERFVRDELVRDEGQGPLNRDESLIASGILDSLALLRLLIFLEEQFHFKVADGEVIPANFETVSQITAFVESKHDVGPG